MNASSKNSIFAIASIVGISLIASYILFHFLTSTGIFKNQYVEFGGAAAFFLVIFYGLKNWYQQLADKANENDGLKQKLKAFEEILSPNIIPEGFKIFSDDDIAFSYPKIWKKEPLSMKIHGLFTENIDSLNTDDDFPSRYVITVTGIGENKLPLRHLLITIKDVEFEKEIAKKMGFIYPFSEQVLKTEIPIEIIFPLLGIKGNDKKEIYYHLMENYLAANLNCTPIKEIEMIDGEESLCLEFLK